MEAEGTRRQSHASNILDMPFVIFLSLYIFYTQFFFILNIIYYQQNLSYFYMSLR